MSDTLTLPDAPEAGREPLAPADVADLGFSAEELDLLVAAGVLVDERRAGPWRPETLADVDWILSRRKQIRFEASERARLHAEAIKRLEAADRAFDRFDADVREIAAASLTGKRKSLILDRCKLQFRTQPGGPKVIDEAEVLAYLRAEGDALGAAPELLAALRVTLTETYEGEDALPFLADAPEGVTVTAKLLHAPVKAYVEALKPTADEHGVAVPATIPGVVIVPSEERFSWE